jgi:hypothetical protein
MEFEILTANNADELKIKIDQFKSTSQKSGSFYKYYYPNIKNISITTNGDDYIVIIEYFIKGLNV